MATFLNSTDKVTRADINNILNFFFLKNLDILRVDNVEPIKSLSISYHTKIEVSQFYPLTTKFPQNKNQPIDSKRITILSFMVRTLMVDALKCRHWNSQRNPVHLSSLFLALKMFLFAKYKTYPITQQGVHLLIPQLPVLNFLF